MNPVSETNDPVEFALLEEIERIDASEDAPERKETRKAEATRRAFSKKNSRYHTDFIYNVLIRIANRYRATDKPNGQSFSYHEVPELVRLEAELLGESLLIRMPADCSMETYFKGIDHIDHRESINGRQKRNGNVKETWTWSNLWLMNGSKNCSKSGASGDDPDRKFSEKKNRWIEPNDNDEKLLVECIEMAKKANSKLLDSKY